jgi:hypothetical protein
MFGLATNLKNKGLLKTRLSSEIGFLTRSSHERNRIGNYCKCTIYCTRPSHTGNRSSDDQHLRTVRDATEERAEFEECEESQEDYLRNYVSF